MTIDRYSILVLSDIHFGHNINHTENIIQNLRKFFITYKKIILKTRLIIISGDVFDKLLSSNGSDINMALEWLTELLIFCKENIIKLRILEGTPGHDWKQVKLLNTILERLKLDVDFKYIEDIEIEYIEDLNTHILYVPDEYKPTTKEIYTEVLFKLKEKNLTHVDMAVMHGAFDYQLPVFIENTHRPDNYLKIVRGPIIIGHIHNRGSFKRIVTPGSFDALTHSDDNKKGGLLINYEIKSKNFNYKFLDNVNALKFKTIDVRDKDIKVIKRDIFEFNRQSNDRKLFLRLYVNKDSILHKNLLELKDVYTNLNISFKFDKLDETDRSINSKKIVREHTALNRSSILMYIKEKTKEEDKSLSDDIIKEFEENY